MFLISSPVWFQRRPNPSVDSAKDIGNEHAAKRIGLTESLWKVGRGRKSEFEPVLVGAPGGFKKEAGTAWSPPRGAHFLESTLSRYFRGASGSLEGRRHSGVTNALVFARGGLPALAVPASLL